MKCFDSVREIVLLKNIRIGKQDSEIFLHKSFCLFGCSVLIGSAE